jgi:sialate O-acetylesterase
MGSRQTLRRLSLAVAFTFCIAALAAADVRLPAILSDHMVLQQQMPLPVWGWAEPGEQVTVTFDKQKQTAKADEKGNWQVKLSPLTASETPAELTIAGKNTVTLKDVLVGEVWLCSGQSNMEFTMRTVKNSAQEIADANHPNLRLFTVPKWVQQEPQKDVKEDRRGKITWDACTPQTVPGFSAVGYFFGRDLQKELHVPVGLIHSSWGGTPAEAWTRHSNLENDPDFQAILDRRAHAKEDYQKALQKWEADSAKAKEQGRAAPRKPSPPEQNQNLASVLYNGMIEPIIPFAIKGAIWYQGESNAGRAYQYRKLLPAMIESWRDQWHEPDMSFLIVSLANYQDPPKTPGESDWAELREAQAMTAAMPHNGQALAIDLADENNPRDIHPKDKQDVGHRLSLVALAKTYGKNIPYSGPEFDSAKFEGDKVRITFKNADGMAAKGSEVKGFQVAAQPQDGQPAHWVWADAKVEGDSVIVSSPEVQKPAAVRYDWANNPQGNLYNKFGLPAEPFRTDKWPGVTEKAK